MTGHSREGVSVRGWGDIKNGGAWRPSSLGDRASLCQGGILQPFGAWGDGLEEGRTGFTRSWNS